MGASAGLQFGAQGDGRCGLRQGFAAATVEFCRCRTNAGGIPLAAARQRDRGEAEGGTRVATGRGNASSRQPSGTSRATCRQTSAQAVPPADEASGPGTCGTAAGLNDPRRETGQAQEDQNREEASCATTLPVSKRMGVRAATAYIATGDVALALPALG